MLCLTVVLGGLAMPAGAQDDPLFTITDVRVEVTAENAVAAREKAFAQAQADAFKKLAERMLPEDSLAKFAPPAADRLPSFINDFEITDERVSAVQYIGTYTFRFRPDAVRGFLGQENLSYADVPSRALLALPFYQWGSRTVLWGTDNPWLAAWSSHGRGEGLVPVVAPLGDAQDMADIGDGDALTYDPAALQTMLARYAAGEAAVMIAAPVWRDPGASAAGGVPGELDIALYRTDQTPPVFVGNLKVESVPGEEAAAFYARAVTRARQALQSDWKNRVQAAPAERNSIRARARFAAMQDWMAVQRALRAAPGVDGFKVLSLRAGEAQVQIDFTGSEDRLRLALAQADLTLSAPQIEFGAVAAAQAPLTYDIVLTRPATGRMN